MKKLPAEVKRIGLMSMLVVLEINGLPRTCTDDELGLAESSIDESTLIEWIISHS